MATSKQKIIMKIIISTIQDRIHVKQKQNSCCKIVTKIYLRMRLSIQWQWSNKKYIKWHKEQIKSLKMCPRRFPLILVHAVASFWVAAYFQVLLVAALNGSRWSRVHHQQLLILQSKGCSRFWSSHVVDGFKVELRALFWDDITSVDIASEKSLPFAPLFLTRVLKGLLLFYDMISFKPS